jgi:hypothetical protein
MPGPFGKGHIYFEVLRVLLVFLMLKSPQWLTEGFIGDEGGFIYAY